MKTKLTLVLSLLVTLAFGQSNTNDDFIQNFYTSCKGNTYGTFLALQKGTQLLETGQYGRSIKIYNSALDKDSSCCDAYYMLAFCNQRQSNYQEAIENCNRSIKINNNNPSAWVIKGTTLLLMNNPVDAMPCFENAKKYAPNQIDCYYGLALALSYQDKDGQALAIIEQFENNSNATASIPDKKKMKKLKEKLTWK